MMWTPKVRRGRERPSGKAVARVPIVLEQRPEKDDAQYETPAIRLCRDVSSMSPLLLLLLIILVIIAVGGGLAVSPLFFILLVLVVLLFFGFGRGGAV